MSQVLGIVYRVISGALLKEAGFSIYSRNQYGKIVFRRTKAPDKVELCKLVSKISQRVAAYLERQEFLERDEENSYLQLDGMEKDPT